MSAKKITIQTLVFADVKKAWAYYTAPEHITQWNFASDDWHCPRAVNDLRAGGILNARMEARDGSVGFDFEAKYDEVNEPQGFRYTMPDGRAVVATFEPAGAGTRVTIAFDPETENPVELQQQGWQAILNNYKKYTDAN